MSNSYETQLHARDTTIYHEYEECPVARRIAAAERIEGTGGKRLCPWCGRRMHPPPLSTMD